MIEKKRFIEIMAKNGLLEGKAEEDVHEFWEQAVSVAEELLPKLPPSRLLSVSRKKRLARFYAACELLQNRIAQGEIFPDVAVFVLNILRLSDHSFRRSMVAFENLVADKLLTRADLVEVPGGTFAAAYARMLYVTF